MTTVALGFDTVYRAISTYGETPSGFLALSRDNFYFSIPDTP